MSQSAAALIAAAIASSHAVLPFSSFCLCGFCSCSVCSSPQQWAPAVECRLSIVFFLASCQQHRKEQNGRDLHSNLHAAAMQLLGQPSCAVHALCLLCMCCALTCAPSSLVLPLSRILHHPLLSHSHFYEALLRCCALLSHARNTVNWDSPGPGDKLSGDTCFAPPRPAMSCQDSEGLTSRTSDSTASLSFASSLLSFLLSGADRWRASTVDCLSRLAPACCCCWAACCLCRCCEGDICCMPPTMLLAGAEVLAVGDSRSRNLQASTSYSGCVRRPKTDRKKLAPKGHHHGSPWEKLPPEAVYIGFDHETLLSSLPMQQKRRNPVDSMSACDQDLYVGQHEYVGLCAGPARGFLGSFMLAPLQEHRLL